MQKLPCHIAIIPDGNRRWAEKERKHRSEGHIEGVERFREISKAVFEIGIPYFTFLAASEYNLKKRNPSEVQLLVSLLQHELEEKSTLENCLESEIRVRVIGNWYNILHNDGLLHSIQLLQNRTREFDQHFLTILFGYSGTHELSDAVKTICKYHPKHIDEEVLRRALWTHDLPPYDLIIRTGACEEGLNWTHNSLGFLTSLLAANAKIFSPPTLWPDFTVGMFRRAVAYYSKAPRRFGV